MGVDEDEQPRSCELQGKGTRKKDGGGERRKEGQLLRLGIDGDKLGEQREREPRSVF